MFERANPFDCFLINNQQGLSEELWADKSLIFLLSEYSICHPVGALDCLLPGLWPEAKQHQHVLGDKSRRGKDTEVKTEMFMYKEIGIIGSPLPNCCGCNL